VVVGSKVPGGTQDPPVLLVSGGLDDDCNLVTSLQLPVDLTSDWPVALEMKVLASVKRQDVEACAKEQGEILNDIHLDLYLPEPSEWIALPEIDDEVLVFLTLPLTSVQTVPT